MARATPLLSLRPPSRDRPAAPSPVALWTGRKEWLVRWGIVGALILTDAAWLAARHEQVDLFGTLGFVVVAALLCIASALAMLSFAMQRYGRPLLIASDFLESAIYVLVLLAFVSPLTSLAASLDFPLVDDALRRADLAFGFDWASAARWVQDRPALDFVLRQSYISFLWQAPIVLLIGSATRPGERNADAIWPYLLSLLACVAVSGVLPALGEPGMIGTKHIEHLQAIRSGQISLMGSQDDGIITFPSFHAALAVIYIYAARRSCAALALLLPLNLLMLAATPTCGGHYLVDVIAGVAIAILSIAIARAPSQTRSQ